MQIRRSTYSQTHKDTHKLTHRHKDLQSHNHTLNTHTYNTHVHTRTHVLTLTNIQTNTVDEHTLVLIIASVMMK